jgi:spore photoproduct lyase
MSFELDEIVIEEGCRASVLAARVSSRAAHGVSIRYVVDGREAARPAAGAADPFGAGKRRMVVMRRRAPFLMACPAGAADFACCGYLVLVLASNCPMDCSYCFLQEYLADNPGFQVYANYADAFDELERMRRRAGGRSLRVGTGELADSLAFDRMTGIARDLVEYFAARDGLTLELKTKTDEIDNLLAVDPRGRTLVSWTLSPQRVFALAEHRTAPPAARLAAAHRVLDAGYRLGFHLDPVIAYPEAERDYLALLDELFDTIAPARISFVSLGGLRMTPALRAASRRRHPRDPLLCGEEVLAPDGRYRTFTPLRVGLLRALERRIAAANPAITRYLCMEPPSIHRRVLGRAPTPVAALGAQLATVGTAGAGR